MHMPASPCSLEALSNSGMSSQNPFTEKEMQNFGCLESEKKKNEKGIRKKKKKGNGYHEKLRLQV